MKSGRIALFKMLTMLLGLILGTLLAEGVLRVSVRYGVPDRLLPFIAFMRQVEGTNVDIPLYEPSIDPFLGYGLRPNIRNNTIRVNSDGFRGPDYTRDVPAGKQRLAVLGDSETFGHLLAEDAALPGALQAQLNRTSGSRYEVLNFGVPGYNTMQEMKLLETKVFKYQPSVVILYYVFNDPILSQRSMLVTKTVFHRLYLVSFFDWFLFKRITRNDIESRYREVMADSNARSMVEFYLDLHSSSYFDTTQSLIRQMARKSRQNGCRFVLVIAPELYGIDDFKNYPYETIHRKLRGLASSDIEVVDPLPDLVALGKKPGELWVTDYDCHKNEEATAAIARAIVRGLRIDGER